MKGDLKTAFETVRGSIFHEPMRMARVDQGRFILIDIMRDANGGSSAFNADALKDYGINPKEFIAALAFTWAQATLDYHDNQGAFQDVLIARCKSCLDTTEEYSLGNHLPENLKARIQDKLARNAHTAPALKA